MARLFGLIGNRTDLAARVLSSEAAALSVTTGGVPHGWGLGFYQGGEVLIRRRPVHEQARIDVASLASDLRADLVVGHVRKPSVGALRTENTHPFRYRQWLFAHTGSVEGLGSVRDRVVESVPEFLRSGIRGETDSEILFHVFLSFLHDSGHLGQSTADFATIHAALRSSLSLVDGYTAEVGAAPSASNIVLSDGESIYALRRGAPMGLRVLQGKADAEMLLGDDDKLRRKVPELGQLHFVIVASDFDDDAVLAASGPGGKSRWASVPDHSIVVLHRGAAPVIEKL